MYKVGEIVEITGIHNGTKRYHCINNKMLDMINKEYTITKIFSDESVQLDTYRWDMGDIRYPKGTTTIVKLSNDISANF